MNPCPATRYRRSRYILASLCALAGPLLLCACEARRADAPTPTAPPVSATVAAATTPSPASPQADTGDDADTSDARETTATPAGMLPVPGGTFHMGNTAQGADPDEGPVHAVTLEDFYLDIHPVTHAAYARCVEQGACRPPRLRVSPESRFAPVERFRTPQRPVTGVSQSDAAAYCAWRGARLPSEAEFERAARGDDQRTYPWGDDPPDDTRAVFGQDVTADAGSCPAGAGPYGHLDLAGNVWEWSRDLYDPLAYLRPSADRGIPGDCPQILAAQNRLRREKKNGYTGSNPIPTTCEFSLRGGAFNYHARGLRAANRVHHPGQWRMIMAGFRCAQDAASAPVPTPP